MSDINKRTWDELINIEIDETTQEKMLKDPALRKNIWKVFEVVWTMQNEIDKKLLEYKNKK